MFSVDLFSIIVFNLKLKEKWKLADTRELIITIIIGHFRKFKFADEGQLSSYYIRLIREILEYKAIDPCSIEKLGQMQKRSTLIFIWKWKQKNYWIRKMAKNHW